MSIRRLALFGSQFCGRTTIRHTVISRQRPIQITTLSRVRWLSKRHGSAVEPPEWEHDEEIEGDEEHGATVRIEQQDESIPEKLATTIDKEQEKPTSEALGLLPQELAAPDQISQLEAEPRTETDSTAGKTTSPLPEEEKSEEQLAADEQMRLVKEQARQSGPLEAVMQTPPPSQIARQHPSLHPSPYVHHFDSYSLVKQLQGGGFTQSQSITAMKGVRSLLAQNLDVAQESLVSKSDVENEVYLFRAACSELGTEIKNNRRLQDEQIRQQRTHLQHEIEQLTQTLNQELLTLNDNVRGMFNDRRMTVREEQKSIDSSVQQITYKISTALAGDSKSGIEGLRWVLISRAALGLAFLLVAGLIMLKYSSYVNHEHARQEKMRQEEDERRKKDGGRSDHSSATDAAAILAAN